MGPVNLVLRTYKPKSMKGKDNDTNVQQSEENDSKSRGSTPVNLDPMLDSAVINNVEGIETIAGSARESLSNDSIICSNEFQDVSQEFKKKSEELIVKEIKSNAGEFKNTEGASKFTKELSKALKNLSTIIAYPAKQRPKQPFMPQPPQAPPPRLPPQPSYYTPTTPQSEPSRGPPQTSNSGSKAEARTNVQEQVRSTQPLRFMPMDASLFFPNALYSTVIWAPFPSKIPANVPSCLAHMVAIDSLYIIQFEMYNYYAYMDEIYLVQNKNGECLYLVYETMDFGEFAFKDDCRAYRLHIMDMYQNEVILMNRLSGCSACCCCYPELQVYAPPNNLIGAITKKYNVTREEYAILDPDRNKIFKMIGPCCATGCLWTMNADFTIHALDENETEVAFIRREPAFYRSFIGSDLFGITFPADMDVRVKAGLQVVFCSLRTNPEIRKIGGLFKVATITEFKKGGEKDINKTGGNNENLKMSIPFNSANVISFLHLIGKLKSLKRTGWVLRNVEDPETVSGHMYRMSIMTFLIPESSGVNKTRCMKLSLVHDLAECIVGDLTPFCGVDASEKHRQEEVAMKELTEMIGDSGTEIYKLYKEYEAQVTDESKFVKDLDRLDMILQAFEYEKLENKPGKLEEFFVSTINKFHFPWTIDIVKEIYKQRNLHIKKESLGSILNSYGPF